MDMDDQNRPRSVVRLPGGDPGGDDDAPPELQAVARLYAAQPVPRPTPEDTARLMARLMVETRGIARVAPAPTRRTSPIAALRVARWRLRLLGPWFWIASVVLLSLLALIPPYVSRANVALPLIVLLPLTAVLSVVHALRASSIGLREVEAAAPIDVVTVTEGLALAIVAYDVALGVSATALLALTHWAPFNALLLTWLGPLLCLTSVSLPVALRWGTAPAIALGAGPWAALAFGALLQPHGFCGDLLALPDDMTSVLAHGIAAGLGLAALLLVFVRGAAWRRLAVS